MNSTTLSATEDRPDAVAASGSAGAGLLRADEVAELLQVSCAWVYAETRKRRIPHLRLGRYVRYRRSAIEAWMEDVERSSAINRRRR
jgi:excisionase family DNA binding protein